MISISESKPNAFRQGINPDILILNEEVQKTKWWTKEDTHLFVVSFTAFFIIFYSFIA